jgi:type VI secretion system secreted protein Hcp
MAVYMQYAQIKGQVTEANHKQWIELSAWQWGIGRSISAVIGSSQSRESSLPSIAEMVITKNLDDSSPDLLNYALNDSKGQKVLIEFTKTGAGTTPDMYLQFELTNTLISGYSYSSGGDKPTESLTLNFTKFAQKYIAYDETNKAQPPKNNQYDTTTAKSG